MRDRTYYVYVMSSVSRTPYTGVTNDLERRVFEHREGRAGSFTARYKVSRLVYFEEFGDISEAIAREKEIKLLTRKRKITLIESMNPYWKDLSREWEEAPAEERPYQSGSGTAPWAALNEVKGLGGAVVPSLRSGRQKKPLRAAATRENDGIAPRALGSADADPAQTNPVRCQR